MCDGFWKIALIIAVLIGIVAVIYMVGKSILFALIASTIYREMIICICMYVLHTETKTHS